MTSSTSFTKIPSQARKWLASLRRLVGRLLLALTVLVVLANVLLRVSIDRATRRMQEVISGLSELEIDKSSEDELVRTVPYLKRSPWDGQLRRTPETGDIDLGTERSYHVRFSNEETWMKYGRLIDALKFCSANARITMEGYTSGCFFLLPDLLGYRYYSFGATVTVLNGKVSSLSYGINDRLAFPHQLGAIVSVRSFHSIWHSHQIGFEVDSLQDENPQFRVSAGKHHLNLEYAYDAPPESTKRAFQADLSCFWSLRGCRSAQQIAPLLWQDGTATETAAIARLQSSEPCPD